MRWNTRTQGSKFQAKFEKKKEKKGRHFKIAFKMPTSRCGNFNYLYFKK